MAHGTPWYLLHDQDQFVYHYTKASTLTIILQSNSLRFSRLESVNDPRESRPRQLGYRSRTPTDEQAVELLHELQYSWRIGCFVRDPYEALSTSARENKGDVIIGASYERGHSRPRMWSQYAQEYTGACLVFDRARLDAAVRRSASAAQIYAGGVEYRNPRVVPNLSEPDPFILDFGEIDRVGVEQACTAHVERHHRELFFLKSKDWSQEHEYRWAVKFEGPEDFHVPVEHALVGVALGDRFLSEEIPAVIEYAQAFPVSLARVEWSNGFPQPMPCHWRILRQAISGSPGK